MSRHSSALSSRNHSIISEESSEEIKPTSTETGTCYLITLSFSYFLYIFLSYFRSRSNNFIVFYYFLYLVKPGISGAGGWMSLLDNLPTNPTKTINLNTISNPITPSSPTNPISPTNQSNKQKPANKANNSQSGMD